MAICFEKYGVDGRMEFRTPEEHAKRQRVRVRLFGCKKIKGVRMQEKIRLPKKIRLINV